MILFAMEEFTARRRNAQEELEALLHAVVAEDFADGENWEATLEKVWELYLQVYAEESGEIDPPDLPEKFIHDVRTSLEKTGEGDKHTPDRIATWLATAILSKATIDAALVDEEELFLEWVDMNDSDVRPAHMRTAGQQRPVGEPFDVDGVAMPYPGWPGAPIELWINCRCTLRPLLASEALIMASSERTDTLGVAVDPENPDPFAKAKAVMGITAAVEEPVEEPEEKAVDESRVPWHGVLAPEGIASGDGRKFALGSLRFRPLPLPLTWQKVSDDAHKGNVTVASIDTIKRVGGEMRATGFMRTTPEADEVVGLLADFGRFGVSIDADDSSFEVDEDEEQVVFTDARISAACIVPIPAFAEAWVALGMPPEGFLDGEDVVQDGDESEETEALVASVGVAEADMFVDVAPGITEDGPGWLTHPVDTDRLRDYWVRGPGAAKIGWGTPGDFNRCRVNTAEYVKPQYLNGYCANRHFDALGFWPGQHNDSDTVAFAKDTLGLTDTDAAEALGLTAAAVVSSPAAWFRNPQFTLDDNRLVEQRDGSYACPITVTDAGQVFGHLAAWGTCHIGYPETCVAPPKSASSYAYFLTGETRLDDDTRCAVGNITIGGGHAGGRLGLRPTLAHYDSTSTVVADVTCGEDDYGIWLAGRIRPGAPEEMIAALQASALSGDWRKVAGEMELVAALAVNVPGFPLTRTQVAASNEGQLSLVASGVVVRPDRVTEERFGMVQMEEFAEAVAAAIEARRERRARMIALAAEVNDTKKRGQ